MKQLHKIVGLFIFIFVVGTTITILSIQKKLNKKNPTEIVESSKDSSKLILKNKKNV